MNSNNRIAPTLYSLGTWFVTRMYVQIPGIKEMMMMIIIIIKCSSSSSSSSSSTHKFKLIKNRETSQSSLMNCDGTEKNLQRDMIPENRQHLLLRNLRYQTGHLNQSNLFHTLTKCFNKAYLISSMAQQHVLSQASSLLRLHVHTHTTIGKTPLDE